MDFCEKKNAKAIIQTQTTSNLSPLWRPKRPKKAKVEPNAPMHSFWHTSQLERKQAKRTKQNTLHCWNTYVHRGLPKRKRSEHGIKRTLMRRMLPRKRTQQTKANKPNKEARRKKAARQEKRPPERRSRHRPQQVPYRHPRVQKASPRRKTESAEKAVKAPQTVGAIRQQPLPFSSVHRLPRSPLYPSRQKKPKQINFTALKSHALQ